MFSKIKNWFSKTKQVTKFALQQDTIDKIVNLVSDVCNVVDSMKSIVEDFKVIVAQAREVE